MPKRIFLLFIADLCNALPAIVALILPHRDAINISWRSLSYRKCWEHKLIEELFTNIEAIELLLVANTSSHSWNIAWGSKGTSMTLWRAEVQLARRTILWPMTFEPRKISERCYRWSTSRNHPQQVGPPPWPLGEPKFACLFSIFCYFWSSLFNKALKL